MKPFVYDQDRTRLFAGKGAQKLKCVVALAYFVPADVTGGWRGGPGQRQRWHWGQNGQVSFFSQAVQLCARTPRDANFLVMSYGHNACLSCSHPIRCVKGHVWSCQVRFSQWLWWGWLQRWCGGVLLCNLLAKVAEGGWCCKTLEFVEEDPWILFASALHQDQDDDGDGVPNDEDACKRSPQITWYFSCFWRICVELEALFLKNRIL